VDIGWHKTSHYPQDQPLPVREEVVQAEHCVIDEFKIHPSSE